MAAFKDNVGAAAVERLAAVLAGAPFDAATFVGLANDGLGALELKARIDHVAAAMRAAFAVPFADAAAHVARTVPPSDLGMWEVWPVTVWVAHAGLDRPDLALPLLAALTRQASAEFAVRPFVDADPDALLDVLLGWAATGDEHVRRLASEGSRPRLPWAPRLRVPPGWALPVLDRLYRDPSEYVRRSVANHLNDVAKDDRDLALDVAARWLADPAPTTPALVRHAMRGLVKAGDPAALRLVGADVGNAVTVTGLTVAPPVVALGGALELAFTVRNDAASPTTVVVDYGVHHVRASGRASRKVFKLTTLRLAAGEERRVTRTHRVEPVTTRRYYPGTHVVDVQCNGAVLATASFELTT